MSQVEEIKKLESELTTKLATAKAAVTKLTVDDEAYADVALAFITAKKELAGLPDKLAAALKADNSEKIAAVGETYIAAIEKLTETVKLAEMLGEPLSRLVYFAATPEAKDADGNVTQAAKPAAVAFNPKSTVKPGARVSTKLSDAAPAKRPYFVKDGTDEPRFNATELVRQFGSDEQKALKYPHTAADAVAAANGFVKVVPAE